MGKGEGGWRICRFVSRNIQIKDCRCSPGDAAEKGLSHRATRGFAFAPVVKPTHDPEANRVAMESQPCCPTIERA
jgi:hypothetical protein